VPSTRVCANRLWWESRNWFCWAKDFFALVQQVLSSLARPFHFATSRAGMSTRLDRVKNWEDLAKEARFRIAEIALRRGISVRTLERYFSTRFRLRPHSWINHLRFNEAKRLLSLGKSVKEVAGALHFKNAAHFSHAFKKQFGVSPSQWYASSSG